MNSSQVRLGSYKRVGRTLNLGAWIQAMMEGCQ